MEELTKQREALEDRYEALMNPDTGIMIKKQTELLQPIIDRINEVLMKIAKDEAYDFIFDATAGPQGNTILFANEKYDISEMIVEALKKDSSSQ
jgi:Skp family chaperone for outer membrane proteins